MRKARYKPLINDGSCLLADVGWNETGLQPNVFVTRKDTFFSQISVNSPL